MMVREGNIYSLSRHFHYIIKLNYWEEGGHFFGWPPKPAESIAQVIQRWEGG